MAFTLTTGSGVNLNDGIRYQVLDVDLGATQRDEAWIESWYNPMPTLTQYVDRKTRMTIVLRVFGRTTSGGTKTAALLQSNVEAVRNEFEQQANTLLWNVGNVTRVISTFPSPIDPVGFDLHGLYEVNKFEVPRWVVQVWRHPHYQNTAREVVI